MSENKELLTAESLLNSDVVANNRMNRGRGCLGQNSYQKDLSFNPVEFLKNRASGDSRATWLDICCGEGRALIEAAKYFADIVRVKNAPSNIKIIGLDLAGMFCERPAGLNNLTLLETPVESFESPEKFDLITCVHGLHYIGDKLSVIRKAAGMLKNDGIFLANLDLKNLRIVDGGNSSRVFSALLKARGFILDRHLLRLNGNNNFDLPFEYTGADDKAGPNYTNQPAVNSYYK